MKMKYSSFAQTLVTIALVQLQLGVAAAEIDPAARLRAAQTLTTSAVVIGLPERRLYPTRVLEADMAKYGCTVKVEDGAALRALFDLLEHADIKLADPNDGENDLRLSVSLMSNDTTLVKLLFAGILRQDGFLHGTMNGAPVIADSQLRKTLREWMAGQPQTAVSPNVQCPS